jgi:hypothetical protein
MSQFPVSWIPARKLEDEITTMQVDVLSARCIADRLRLRNAMTHVADAATTTTLEKMISDLQSVLEFVREVEQVHGARRSQPDAGEESR